jgi:beta-glucosidase
VQFTITRQDLSFFDADAHEWVAEEGDYEVLLGTSSADIRARLPFKL